LLAALVPYILSENPKFYKVAMDVAYHLAKIPENAKAYLTSGDIPIVFNQGPLLKHINRHFQHHQRLRSWIVVFLNTTQGLPRSIGMVALCYTLAVCECGMALQQALFGLGGLDTLFHLLKEQKDPRAMRAASITIERVITMVTGSEIIRPFHSNLSSPLPNHRRLFNSEKFSDLIFEIRDQSCCDGASWPCFPSHKAVLWQNSEYFRAMIDSGMRESCLDTIAVDGVPFAVFVAMMRFIYTGQTDINQENVNELLDVANRYLLGSLKYLCEEYIVFQQLELGKKEKKYRKDGNGMAEVAQALLLADATQAGELSRACTRHLLTNFSLLADSVTCGPDGLEPVLNAMRFYVHSLQPLFGKANK